jgi:hypothetical protein
LSSGDKGLPLSLRNITSFRRLGVGALIAMTISSILIFGQVRSANRINFEIDISSPVNGVVQLFYDQGYGFQEADSEMAVLRRSETPRTYRFGLPSAKVRNLRFDPNNAGGIYVIRNPRLVTAAGKQICAISLSAFTSPHQIASLVRTEDELRLEVPAENKDPQMLVDLEASCAPAVQDVRSFDLDIPSAMKTILLVSMAVFVVIVFEPRLSRGRARLASWVNSSPFRTIGLVALIFTIISCYPVIFFGKSFVSPNNGGAAQLYPGAPFVPGGSDPGNENVRGSDVGAMMWEYRPYSVIQNDAISDGELPLWNRYGSGGTTLLAQGVSMIGDPLHWITVAGRGSALAWDAKFGIAKLLFCASAGFLIFMVTGSLLPALVIAASSAFLGFFIYRFNHPAFFAVCYAPMLLLGWAGVLRAGRKAPRIFILLLVVSVLMELNSGTAKEGYILVIMLNGTGALALLLQRCSWREKGQKFLVMSIVGLATVLLLAPFWLIFADELRRAYTQYSQPETVSIPFRLLAGFFEEIFYAQASSEHIVIGPAINMLIGGALLGGIACAPRLRREPWFVACLIGATLSGSIAFGIVPASLIEKIPVIKNVAHVGNTFSCVLLIQSLVVAGFAIREFQTSVSSTGWRRDCIVVTFLGSVIALNYASQIAGHARWSAAAVILATAPLIGLVATVFASRQMFLGKITFRNTCVLIVGLCAIHLRLGQHLETGRGGLDLYLANPHTRPDFSVGSPAIELLPAPGGFPYRVVGVDGILFSGYQASLGIESINGPDPLVNNHVRELLSGLGFEQMYGWGWLVMVHPGDLARISKGLDVLNVRYVLLPATTKIAADLSVLGERDLTVVERPTAWPRAYFDDQILTYSDQADLKRIFAGSQNPVAAVQSGDQQAPPATEGKGLVVAATDYQRTANSTTFSIDAPSKGVAVLGEAFLDRSFIATLNGKPVDWFRVNHAFKGVLIPGPGKYVISFTYRPPLLDAALMLSAIGALLLCVLLWYLPRFSLFAEKTASNDRAVHCRSNW